jgi:hypothetical protein
MQKGSFIDKPKKVYQLVYQKKQKTKRQRIFTSSWNHTSFSHKTDLFLSCPGSQSWDSRPSVDKNKKEVFMHVTGVPFLLKEHLGNKPICTLLLVYFDLNSSEFKWLKQV